MPTDLIPIVDLHTNTVRESTGGNGGQSILNIARFKNIEFRPDGTGGYTGQSRLDVTRSVAWSSDDASSSRGRGIVGFDGYGQLRVDEDTYYYNGGSDTITGGNSFYAEYLASFIRARDSGVNNLIIVNAGHTSTHASANHGNVWYVPDSTTGATRITDADMPGNNGVSLTRGGAYLDGYLFLLDINGQIHNSNLNDITTWTATDFLTASSEPDYGIFLGKMGDNIVYIGTESIEFFYNAGNASGSPLSVRGDLSYNVGCEWPNTIIQIEDVIFFVGKNPGGNPTVYKLENFQLTRIGNDFIDRSLLNTSSYMGAITDLEPVTVDYTMAYLYSEMAGPVLVFNRGVVGFWHNINMGIWSLVDLGFNLTYKGVFSSTIGNFPLVYSDHPKTSTLMFSNGAVATINNAASASGIRDLGAASDADSYVFTAPWNGGTNRKKRINRVRVIGKPLVNSTYDPTPFQFGWIDLKAPTSSGASIGDMTNEREIDISDDRNNELTRCGTTRQRIWGFKFTDTAMAVVSGIEVDYEIVGT